MAVNNGFESYKITREIKKNGVHNIFYRDGKNEFGEPDKNTRVTIGALTSLYHEQSAYVQLSVADGVQYRTKKMPMLLALFTDVKYLGLQTGDFCIVNNRRYTITNILNLYNWDIIADISLEVSDNGSN